MAVSRHRLRHAGERLLRQLQREAALGSVNLEQQTHGRDIDHSTTTAARTDAMPVDAST